MASIDAKRNFILVTGGVETTLMYQTDFPIRCEAAYETLLTPKWEKYVENLIRSFCDVALKYDKPIFIQAMTWRASRNWYDKMDISPEIREKIPALCVQFAKRMADYVNKNSQGNASAKVLGLIGPMSDAYVYNSEITFEQARAYHRETIKSLKQTGLDHVLGGAITGSMEASAISKEAADAGIRCDVGFTLDTNGKLPSGETLKEAIEKVDAVAPPGQFEIICVHPIYIKPLLVEGIKHDEPWVKRLKGIRANASSKTHEELDKNTGLDEGNPKEWAKELKELADLSSFIEVTAGCCGTSVTHCEEIAKLIS